MTRLPITFAAVLLSAWLLALACLPEPPTCKQSLQVPATSERGLFDPFRPPSAVEYLLWACEELGDVWHARSWAEAWWQVKSAGWYLRDAWEAARGREARS